MNYTDSASIKAVQSAINAAGYQPPLVVDGVTGPKTNSGVRWFQQQHGLAVDGLIGPATMAATVAPTPAQAAAAMSTVGISIPGGPVWQPAGAGPSNPAPLVATPVAAMVAPAQVNIAPSQLPATKGPSAVYTPPKGTSLMAGNIGGVPIPALIGAAVGAAGGAFFGLVWALAGLAGGGAAGYGVSTLLPGATMHGEDSDPEFCTFDADYGCDEPTIVAGEIGVEVSSSQLKG